MVYGRNKAAYTLYRIVKRSVAESVPDSASVHTWNAAIAITRNSRKTRNSFSGEFRDPSYRFWPYT